MAETTDKPMVLDVRNLRIEATRAPDAHVTVVDDVSFTVSKGEVLGLVGESGAGKSAIGLATLAYARGDCRITGGQVLFQGHELRDLRIDGRQSLRGAKVGYVAQDAAAGLNPAHTIFDQACEVALQHGVMTFAPARAEAIRLFRELDLPNPEMFGNRYPQQLSDGQSRRVLAAMAMMTAPDLLVFDEPTAELDVTTQFEVLASFRRVIRAQDAAAIFISRDLSVAAQIADRVIVLQRGKAVEEGPTLQILQQPQSEYTRRLMGKDAAQRQTRFTETHADAAVPVLQTQNLVASDRDGRRVLDDVSIALMRGETLALLGESESGTSALARVVCGLLSRQEGDVLLAGASLPVRLASRSRDQLRRIQMIHGRSDTALNPRQTLFDLIGRPVAFYFGRGRSDVRARVEELMQLVELPPELLTYRADGLSAGQKQRVCLARAAAAEPDLIVCDDVTSTLDPLDAEEFVRLLRRIQDRTGIACLFITRDPTIARRIADAAAVLQDGQVMAYGPARQVFNPPYHQHTEFLLSSVPEMRPDWLTDVLRRRRKVMR